MLKSDAAEARAPPPEMEDAEVYRKQLELFIRCSTDKRIELVKLGEVIADLRHRWRFLDVGAGSGDLTIPLVLMTTGNVVVASALWQMWDFPDLSGASAVAMLLVAGLLMLVVPLQIYAARQSDRGH